MRTLYLAKKKFLSSFPPSLLHPLPLQSQFIQHSLPHCISTLLSPKFSKKYLQPLSCFFFFHSYVYMTPTVLKKLSFLQKFICHIKKTAKNRCCDDSGNHSFKKSTLLPLFQIEYKKLTVIWAKTEKKKNFNLFVKFIAILYCLKTFH